VTKARTEADADKPMGTKLKLTDWLLRIKHLDYVRPSAATGAVAEVYRQADREFGLAADPIVLHSPLPALLRAFWELGRETVLVCQSASRLEKEALIAAVSVSNVCPFCVDAHTLIAASLSDGGLAAAVERHELERIGDPRLRALVEWGYATQLAPAERVAPLPFGGERAPELIGTAVLFHYINRVVTVFVAGERLPRNASRGWARRLGAIAMGSVSRQIIVPGPSGMDGAAPSAAAPPWSAADARIADRFARFQCELDALATRHLTGEVRECVSSAIDAWQGGDPALGRGWLEPWVAGLPARDAAQARLALLAALAPHQIDDGLIGAFRVDNGTDAALLATVAWPAMGAALRIGGWLAASMPAA
jgi:AhpD family alkylhydroperoxidase